MAAETGAASQSSGMSGEPCTQGAGDASRADRAEWALAELATEAPDLAALEFVRPLLCEWWKAKGTKALEKVLGLRSGAERRRKSRDFWAGEALRAIEGKTPHQKAARLHAHLLSMETRHTWRRWAQCGGPPDTASPVDRAAFHVLDYGPPDGRSRVPSLSTLRNIANGTG